MVSINRNNDNVGATAYRPTVNQHTATQPAHPVTSQPVPQQHAQHETKSQSPLNQAISELADQNNKASWDPTGLMLDQPTLNVKRQKKKHKSFWDYTCSIGRGAWNAAKGATVGFAKNFVKGCFCDDKGNFSLWKTAKTVALGSAAVAACVFIPGAGVVLAGAGLAMGGFNLAKHSYTAGKHLTNGNTALFEQEMAKVGESFTETALAAVAIAPAWSAASAARVAKIGQVAETAQAVETSGAAAGSAVNNLKSVNNAEKIGEAVSRLDAMAEDAEKIHNVLGSKQFGIQGATDTQKTAELLKKSQEITAEMDKAAEMARKAKEAADVAREEKDRQKGLDALKELKTAITDAKDAARRQTDLTEEAGNLAQTYHTDLQGRLAAPGRFKLIRNAKNILRNDLPKQVFTEGTRTNLRNAASAARKFVMEGRQPAVARVASGGAAATNTASSAKGLNLIGRLRSLKEAGRPTSLVDKLEQISVPFSKGPGVTYASIYPVISAPITGMKNSPEWNYGMSVGLSGRESNEPIADLSIPGKDGVWMSDDDGNMVLIPYDMPEGMGYDSSTPSASHGSGYPVHQQQNNIPLSVPLSSL